MADPIYAYCSKEDVINLAIQAQAIKKIPPDVQDRSILANSRIIDSYLRSHFKLPLIQVGADVARCCAVLVAFDLLASRGFSPEGDADEVLVMRYDQAIDWLKLISSGRAVPDVTDSAPGATEGKPSTGPRVRTSASRGWSRRGTCEPPGGFSED